MMLPVAVCPERLQGVEVWAIQQAREALEKVYEETGRRISWTEMNNKNAVAPALEAIGVEVPRGEPSKNFPEGQYLIDKELLDKIDHPVAELLARPKKFNKVVTTFVNSIRQHEVNWRIHCTFNQLRVTKDEESGDEAGGRYGRLSCVEPNMQQQPSRDPEIGPRWRSIFVPDDGMLWACLDFSQQEPRWLVHFAELCGLPRAEEMADRYREDPLIDNHDMVTRLIHGDSNVESWDKRTYKKHRDDCKQTLLGLMYSMGGGKLCRKLGLPTVMEWSQKLQRMVERAGPEGQAILDQFNSGLPFVRRLSYLCADRARERGYTETVLGRRCRFPRKEDGSFDWTNKALNRLIQGSSADQTKVALVACDSAGHEIQLQVHDELDLSVRDRAQAEEVSEIMRTCVPANLPFRVDVEVGPSWGEAA